MSDTELLLTDDINLDDPDDIACVKTVRLNLGAGDWCLKGYINVDRQFQPAQHLGDDDIWRDGAWVFPLTGYHDSSVDEIRASHVLEHFSHQQTAAVLAEWIRVLKPNGVLKVAVPDFAKIAAWYNSDPNSQLPIQGYLMGGHVDENDHHGAIFDRDGLTAAFEALGLVDIGPWESEVQDCASLPVSLNLMGRKPLDGEAGATASQAVPVEPTFIYEDVPDGMPLDVYRSHPMRKYADLRIPHGEVRALLSAPRLTFTQSMFDAHKAFTTLDIPWQVIGGAYWQKSIEIGIDEQRAAGAKYILTLDYDTVFDWRDVQSLYGLMEEYPEAGAICSMQMRRELGTLLVGIRDPETDTPMARISLDKMGEDLLPVATGHFGLTIIRASCLEDLSRPWMEMKPNSKGKWVDETDADGKVDGTIDADVNFWLKFRDAGHRLYQANRVVIGHSELVVTWPDKRLQPIVQPSGQYSEFGRPGEGSGIWR